MIVCGPRYRAVAGVGAVGGVVPFVFFERCGGGIGKADGCCAGCPGA